MGAVSIVRTGYGKTISSAFKLLQKEAELEHGQDIYNGEINNCEFISDWTSKRKQFKTEDDFIDYILKNTNKREVIGYCTKQPTINKNKIKSKVKTYPVKEARKWETRYIGYEKGIGYDNVICSEKTQGAAIKKARAFVEKHPTSRGVKIQVEKILTDKKAVLVAEVEYKASTREQVGTYVFVGYAPY